MIWTRNRSRIGGFVLAPLLAPIFAVAAVDAAAAQTIDAELRRAFIAFYPMYEMARLRHIAVDAPGNPMRVPINQYQHGKRLLDHRARVVTAPNNDTIYSSARLDLSNGPIVVTMPRIERRYYSLQFMNAYTDNIALPGSRTDGAGPMKIAVAGPGWQGPLPDHDRRLDADTNDLWLLVRILVAGESDLPNVAAIQSNMQIIAPPGPYAGLRQIPAKDPTPEMFVTVINDMLGRNPPQGLMLDQLRAVASLGLRPGEIDAWQTMPAGLRQRWETQWPFIWNELRQLHSQGSGIGRHTSGWEFPPPGIGRWGSNLTLRAAVALRGIAALDSAEVLYLNAATDAKGERLDGHHRYRIRVPAQGVPVNAFWSITMYEIMPDGRFFFVDNPIRRYSVGDRTQGLVKNADGSFDLWLLSEAPTDDDRKANWLPAPKGPFRMSLRAYLPTPELVSGKADLPVIEKLD